MFIRGGYGTFHPNWDTFEREGAADEDHAGVTKVNSTAPGKLGWRVSWKSSITILLKSPLVPLPGPCYHCPPSQP